MTSISSPKSSAMPAVVTTLIEEIFALEAGRQKQSDRWRWLEWSSRGKSRLW
jgi:hypothetical protein